MHMADWIARLDDFIRISGHDILTHAGRVSHEQAEEHAHAQYEQYDSQRRTLAASDTDFDQAVKRITDTEADKSKSPRRRTRKRQENEPARDE